jgi:hypothetical protein
MLPSGAAISIFVRTWLMAAGVILEWNVGCLLRQLDSNIVPPRRAIARCMFFETKDQRCSVLNSFLQRFKP